MKNRYLLGLATLGQFFFKEPPNFNENYVLYYHMTPSFGKMPQILGVTFDMKNKPPLISGPL